MRDVSSSTMEREEPDPKKKILMKAYMFQRRVLFGCSILMVISLLVWIIAIATDHWIIISGNGGKHKISLFIFTTICLFWMKCLYLN